MAAAKATGTKDLASSSLKVIADHIRAASFLIVDGVLPGNEGRGYVLRKIMRRALRHIRMIGLEEPFLYKLTGFVADWMKGPYPDMLESVRSSVTRTAELLEHLIRHADKGPGGSA